MFSNFFRRLHPSITLIAAVVTAVFVPLLVLGVLFAVQGRSYVDQQMRDHLVSFAAVSATLFTGEELDAIQSPEDITSQNYNSVVERLAQIMESDENVWSTYIMRRTDDPMTLEFVADAESLLSFEEQDLNGDGVLDESERMPLPGEPYDISDVPALQLDAFEHPSIDEEITFDQWGSVISSYAPVYRKNGTVAGIVGIDMLADDYIGVLHGIFPGMAILLVVILGLFITIYVVATVLLRQVAFHRQLEGERQSMLQIVMHELGEPTTMLNWTMEMLESDTSMSRTEIQDHIRGMRKAVEWLQHIYQTLVRVDRAESNRDVRSRDPVGIRGAIGTVRDELKLLISESNQKLKISIEDHPHVYLDRDVLLSIIRELVRNASTYSPKGAVIEVTACPQKHRKVLLQVIDKGCGIPQKDFQRIFKRFVRGANAGRYKPTGTGLGLYVVSTVVRKAGGKIWIKSKTGEGTTVSVLLPGEKRKG